MKEIMPGITADPAIRFGKPIIAGTRVPVDIVIRELGGGMAIPDLMRQYDLTEDQVRAALRYAADIVAVEELAVV